MPFVLLLFNDCPSLVTGSNITSRLEMIMNFCSVCYKTQSKVNICFGEIDDALLCFYVVECHLLLFWYFLSSFFSTFYKQENPS